MLVALCRVRNDRKLWQVSNLSIVVLDTWPVIVVFRMAVSLLQLLRKVPLMVRGSNVKSAEPSFSKGGSQEQ